MANLSLVSYTVPPWPTTARSKQFSNGFVVEWVIYILLIIVIILLFTECFCVPLFFCDNYKLYSLKWYPYYYSQRYVPVVYKKNMKPLRINRSAFFSPFSGKRSGPHSAASGSTKANTNRSTSSKVIPTEAVNQVPTMGHSQVEVSSDSGRQETRTVPANQTDESPWNEEPKQKPQDRLRPPNESANSDKVDK